MFLRRLRRTIPIGFARETVITFNPTSTMKNHPSQERRTGLPANPTGGAPLPAGAAIHGGTLRIRYAQPAPSTELQCSRATRLLGNSVTELQCSRVTWKPDYDATQFPSYNVTAHPSVFIASESRENIGDVSVAPLTLTRSLRRQRKGSLPLPCGRVFPPLPHHRPDAWSASFDTGIWECPIVSTADHASDLPAPLPTHRAHLGSVAPVQIGKAKFASRFAPENCVFAGSVAAQSAPPLLGKRKSEVISRVTRKSLRDLRATFVNTSPLRGATVWRQVNSVARCRCHRYAVTHRRSLIDLGFGGIRNPRRFPASLSMVAGGQTGSASLRTAPVSRPFLRLARMLFGIRLCTLCTRLPMVASLRGCP